jgi:hypothetical protein
MKRNKQGLKFPIRLIILDLIGTIVLGLGLAKILAGIDIIPANMRFDNDGLALILLGVLLMMPMMNYILNVVRHKFTNHN